MRIVDLMAAAEGTKVSEFTLLIRTARGTFTDSEGRTWQDVVFIDPSGEMQGQIEIESESNRWKSKTNICIMEAEVQFTDHRGKGQNKLMVFRCFDSSLKLSHDLYDGMIQEQWNENNEAIIRSKVRCWLVAAAIQGKVPMLDKDPDKEFELQKKAINRWVDFVMTGE